MSYPWSVAFLPDGGYLVTERDGALKHVSQDGEQSVVEGTPDVFAQGQGGLLDVVLSPDFENDRTVYLTFSQGSPEGAGTSLFKATLAEGDGGLRLENGETIFLRPTINPMAAVISAPAWPSHRTAHCS
ncbi:PQQ-dependent sugar dehydrogenase [Roseibium salinum]|nr:PQQ-dependent sugar dehydrogenase [Roseibium salinum]